MILAAPHVLLALRWVPPAIALVGSTATYISAWAFIRLLTWPLSDRCYRAAEETLYVSYQYLVGFLFETWSGVEVSFHSYGRRSMVSATIDNPAVTNWRLPSHPPLQFHYYGDQLPDAAENVLYISNHQCTVDWVVAETLCLRQGRYGGRNRYILKDSLKYVPLYGWHLGAVSCFITVARACVCVCVCVCVRVRVCVFLRARACVTWAHNVWSFLAWRGFCEET